MKKAFAMAAAVWTLLAAVFLPVSVYAAEETDSTVAGTAMRTDTDVEVYQQASGTSKLPQS